jgi:choline dehydrogenase-like flavoprotein
MEEGLEKLGWHVGALPRSTQGCAQDAQCGYCGFGCRHGAKQSRVFLEDATASGARIISGVNVERVLISGGKATGVEGSANGHRVRINARVVVVTAGAIESPALLLRSGLRGQVGRNLHLHPGTAAFGVFDEEVRPWEGTLQARYSTHLRDTDDGYGPIFETVPLHPGAAAPHVVPWTSAAEHRDRMDHFANLSFCAVLPRDASAGRVRIGKDGNPRIDYKLNGDDGRRITEGVIAAGQVLEAAGAKEVYTLHSAPLSYTPGPGAHESWASDVRRAGYCSGRATFASYHQMGSCRMGSNPRASVVNADNECHEVSNLFVADSSCFPNASGVNPMLSVYGIANRAAKRIATRLS